MNFNTKNVDFVWIAALLVLLLGLNACEEKDYAAIILNMEADTTLMDTSYMVGEIPAKQDKIVVIEEFSGVACVNCPQGAKKVEEIIEAYPGRVISTTMHAGGFAEPFANSQEDFAIDETEDLNTFFTVSGYPAAVIDRAIFDGQAQEAIAANLTSWEVFTEERLQLETPVNLTVTMEYNDETRRLKARVEAVYTNTVEAEHKLSVFLVESGIIDLQDDIDLGLVEDYEHNHVVRDMLTASRGIVLYEGIKEAGLMVVREFAIVLADNWKPENCEVLTFVHKSADSKEIVQGAKVKVE